MHLRRMATGSLLGMFPLLLMVFLGLWWIVHCTGFFLSDEYNDKCFRKTVEMVVPNIESYRYEHGHLPDTLRIKGLVGNWENSYVDTTRGNYMMIIYYHSGDSAYTLTQIDWWAQYVSAPNFEGYLFHYWGEAGDSVRVDTVNRQHKIKNEY